MREVGYASAYTFKYSIRPGTPGADMTDQVPEAIKTERLARLQRTGDDADARVSPKAASGGRSTC